MKKIAATLFSALVLSLGAQAQDDLEKLLATDDGPTYTLATFKATRIVNLQTVENLRANHLDFRIHHRFGALNTGIGQFWGLDAATIKLSLEYGITDNFMVGVGRSSLNKLVDVFGKYRIVRQSTGQKSFPVTISLFGNAGVLTNEVPMGSKADNIDWTLERRLSYVGQVLIARKFNENLSLQLSPTIIHRNVVMTKNDQNTMMALGLGGRYKLTKRLSMTGEYNYQLPGYNRDNYFDSFSLGLDIETGGHVFQLFCTNSQGMTEQQFIAETPGGWGKGNISFGFNISRVFGLGSEKSW